MSKTTDSHIDDILTRMQEVGNYETSMLFEDVGELVITICSQLSMAVKVSQVSTTGWRIEVA